MAAFFNEWMRGGPMNNEYIPVLLDKLKSVLCYVFESEQHGTEGIDGAGASTVQSSHQKQVAALLWQVVGLLRQEATEKSSTLQDERKLAEMQLEEDTMESSPLKAAPQQMAQLPHKTDAVDGSAFHAAHQQLAKLLYQEAAAGGLKAVTQEVAKTMHKKAVTCPVLQPQEEVLEDKTAEPATALKVALPKLQNDDKENLEEISTAEHQVAGLHQPVQEFKEGAEDDWDTLEPPPTGGFSIYDFADAREECDKVQRTIDAMTHDHIDEMELLRAKYRDVLDERNQFFGILETYGLAPVPEDDEATQNLDFGFDD
jgi:hypothetical protein